MCTVLDALGDLKTRVLPIPCSLQTILLRWVTLSKVRATKELLSLELHRRVFVIILCLLACCFHLSSKQAYCKRKITDMRCLWPYASVDKSFFRISNILWNHYLPFQAKDLMSVLQEANQVVNPKLLELAQCGMGFKGKYGECNIFLAWIIKEDNINSQWAKGSSFVWGGSRDTAT